MAQEVIGRGPAVAREEIRRAEAARVLGLLDAADQPANAAQWLLDGIDTPNVHALAGLAGPAGMDVSGGVKEALVAEIAADLGISFSTLQDARRVHANEIIRSFSQGDIESAQIYGLSNGFTDEWSAKLRRFFSRRLRGD
jgi:hypothetical protein